jgi:hypothetical protein
MDQIFLHGACSPSATEVGLESTPLSNYYKCTSLADCAGSFFLSSLDGLKELSPSLALEASD